MTIWQDRDQAIKARFSQVDWDQNQIAWITGDDGQPQAVTIPKVQGLRHFAPVGRISSQNIHLSFPVLYDIHRREIEEARRVLRPSRRVSSVPRRSNPAGPWDIIRTENPDRLVFHAVRDENCFYGETDYILEN